MSNNSLNICAGIITFNPDLQLLKQNIESIYNQVGCVIVFDNGSSNINLIEELLLDFNNCNLIKEPINKGIAYALNRVCEWSIQKGYNWIITLDQDSISPINMINVLAKYANDNVAIVSPNILYRNNEVFSIKSENLTEEPDWVITSASLTNLAVWKEIHGFDEWLFIDGVDYDYCLRAKVAGYKIIKSYEIELLHELGNLKCIKIFHKVIYITNHSSFRKYYMARNTIYLHKKLQTGKPVRTIAKYIFKILFFENNKIKKISSILKGVFDGIEKSKSI